MGVRVDRERIGHFCFLPELSAVIPGRERIIRLKDPNCHAEYPPSRTRRMITNVRITGMEGDLILAAANFAIFRHRRNEPVPRQFIGRYRYKLKRTDAGLKIQERRAILDAEELGAMGAVSFLL